MNNYASKRIMEKIVIFVNKLQKKVVDINLFILKCLHCFILQNIF